MASTLENLLVKISGDSSKLQGDLDEAIRMSHSGATKMERAFGKIAVAGQRLGTVGRGLTVGLTVPLVAAGGAALASAVKLGNFADRMLDLEQMTGLSTDTLQEFENVARAAGVSSETLSGAAEGLTRRLRASGEESKTFTDNVRALGVSTRDTDGSLRDMDDLMPELIGKLGDIDSITERNAVSMQLFGRTATELAPVLALGSDEIERLTREAHEMGQVLDREALNAANAFRIEWEQLMAELGLAGREIQQALIPAMTDFAGVVRDDVVPVIQDVAEKAADLIKWWATLDDSTKKLYATFAGATVAAGPVLTVTGTLMTSLPVVAAGVATLTTRMGFLFGPGGLILAGVVALDQMSAALSGRESSLSSRLDDAGAAFDRFYDAIESRKDVLDTFRGVVNTLNPFDVFQGESERDFFKDTLGLSEAELAEIGLGAPNVVGASAGGGDRVYGGEGAGGSAGGGRTTASTGAVAGSAESEVGVLTPAPASVPTRGMSDVRADIATNGQLAQDLLAAGAINREENLNRRISAVSMGLEELIRMGLDPASDEAAYFVGRLQDLNARLGNLAADPSGVLNLPARGDGGLGSAPDRTWLDNLVREFGTGGATDGSVSGTELRVNRMTLETQATQDAMLAFAGGGVTDGSVDAGELARNAAELAVLDVLRGAGGFDPTGGSLYGEAGVNAPGVDRARQDAVLDQLGRTMGQPATDLSVSAEELRAAALLLQQDAVIAAANAGPNPASRTGSGYGELGRQVGLTNEERDAINAPFASGPSAADTRGRVVFNDFTNASPEERKRDADAFRDAISNGGDDFQDLVIAAGATFATDLATSIQSGDVGGAIEGLFGAGGSVLASFAGPFGPLVQAGTSILGGLFGGLFSDDPVKDQERAQGASTRGASTIEFRFEQYVNLAVNGMPELRQALTESTSDVLRLIEGNLIPRLARLEEGAA